MTKLWGQRARYILFRLTVYGSMCICGEILFYNVTSFGRGLPAFLSWVFDYRWVVDTRLDLDGIWETPGIALYGQASLWMFLVYGTIGVFALEPAIRGLKAYRVPWPVRGIAYTAIVLVTECSWGWLLRGVTGYDIWWYADRWALARYTSLSIAPVWFVVGLLSERYLQLLDDTTSVTWPSRQRSPQGARPASDVSAAV